MGELIMYCLTIIAAIIGIIVYKKIDPANYKIYIGYAIGIMVIATSIFEPWRFF